MGDRQTDLEQLNKNRRKREGKRLTNTDRLKETDRHVWTRRGMHWQTEREDKQMDRDRETDIQADRQMHRQATMQKQTNRQIDWQEEACQFLVPQYAVWLRLISILLQLETTAGYTNRSFTTGRLLCMFCLQNDGRESTNLKCINFKPDGKEAF